MIDEIKKELSEIKEEKYKIFSSSLLPNVKNILGVRLPILRKIAKRISKNNYLEFFKENDDEFMELTLIEAMTIGFINDNFENILKLIKNFIPKIDNWSVCDTFCSSLKIIKDNKNEMKKFLEKYFNSKKEFELRFCFVILLHYYIDEIDYVLDKILNFNNDTYYAKMGVAWCLSYCFMNDFNKTLNFIKSNKDKINPFVYKKGISKAIESFQVTKEQKNILKTL